MNRRERNVLPVSRVINDFIGEKGVSETLGIVTLRSIVLSLVDMRFNLWLITTASAVSSKIVLH